MLVYQRVIRRLIAIENWHWRAIVLPHFRGTRADLHRLWGGSGVLCNLRQLQHPEGLDIGPWEDAWFKSAQIVSMFWCFFPGPYEKYHLGSNGKSSKAQIGQGLCSFTGGHIEGNFI